MDFLLSAEQRELTVAAAVFARREFNRDLAKRDDAGEFSREAWRRLHHLYCPVQGISNTGRATLLSIGVNSQGLWLLAG